MMTPLLHLDLPDAGAGDPAHFALIQIVLEAVCRANEWLIRYYAKQGLPVPPLYMSGVRYASDPPGHEDWRTCISVLARGKGDCDNLVAWRVGELWAAGVACEPVLKWQWVPRQKMIELGYPARKLPKGGVWLTHCLVRYADGAVEDPSKELGMGGNFLEAI